MAVFGTSWRTGSFFLFSPKILRLLCIKISTLNLFYRNSTRDREFEKLKLNSGAKRMAPAYSWALSQVRSAVWKTKPVLHNYQTLSSVFIQTGHWSLLQQNKVREKYDQKRKSISHSLLSLSVHFDTNEKSGASSEWMAHKSCIYSKWTSKQTAKHTFTSIHNKTPIHTQQETLRNIQGQTHGEWHL